MNDSKSAEDFKVSFIVVKQDTLPRRAAIDSIESLQSELDLVDIWRIKNPQTRSYTWSQKSPTVLCRLDFWLISNNLCDFINASEIQPAIRTDHAATTLVLGDIGEIKGTAWYMENECFALRG